MAVTEDSDEKEASSLRQQKTALREQNRALRAEVVQLRQQANYYRTQHQRAVQRTLDLEGQVKALKAKVAELQQRLFGRKSERVSRANSASGATRESTVARRARGQQPGSTGHGRKLRDNLPVEETVLDLERASKCCPHCGLVWEAFGSPHTSERIEWRVRLVRVRTVRPKYRRPEGCHCDPQRPDIISAPLAPAVIPKGILGPDFLSEVLVLKFLYHTPLERIRAMMRDAGLKLSTGTLCGALQKLTPLFAPLYEAIRAQSRQAPLSLMDETRWEVFVEEPNKGSHRWWLWVVVTHQTRFYIVAPSRSAAVPKAYFDYDPQEDRCTYEPMVVVDRYKAYAFLKELLELAYCWAHYLESVFIWSEGRGSRLGPLGLAEVVSR